MHPVGAGATSMADMMAKLQDKKYRELPLVIKADVQGSAEAIIGSLDKPCRPTRSARGSSCRAPARSAKAT
jgi:translation initiation factor IF-2